MEAFMNLQIWEALPWEQVTPDLKRKIVTGSNVMLAMVDLMPGSVVPEHSHLSEQISYMLEGSLKMWVAGEEIILKAGQVLVIPAHTPHRAVAEEKALTLDVFSPIRQDWLDHTDDYLRRGR
jgi:quercetin dioxygenase-like cupin family protein